MKELIFSHITYAAKKNEPLICRWKKPKQDGRLAPAYFLPNYNYFDKLLQTVKDRTTVLLVFKEFLQTSVPTVFSVISAKVYHDFPLEKFCLIVPKNFEQELFCVSESFGYRKILSLRGENRDLLKKNFCLAVPKNFVGEPLCAVFQKISRSEKVYG